MTIWTVSSNVPGYLPMDDEPYSMHVEGESDAPHVAGALADLIRRDGEASGDTADTIGVAEDYALVESMQPGGERYRQMESHLTKAIQQAREYGVYVKWSANPTELYYWASPSEDPDQKCSDDECGVCFPRIQVHAAHFNDAEVTADVRAVAAGDKNEIEPGCAAAIASWFQSPGRTGSHFASFASGCRVLISDVLADIDATLRELNPEAERAAELNHLRQFVINNTESAI